MRLDAFLHSWNTFVPKLSSACVVERQEENVAVFFLLPRGLVTRTLVVLCLSGLLFRGQREYEGLPHRSLCCVLLFCIFLH